MKAGKRSGSKLLSSFWRVSHSVPVTSWCPLQVSTSFTENTQLLWNLYWRWTKLSWKKRKEKEQERRNQRIQMICTAEPSVFSRTAPSPALSALQYVAFFFCLLGLMLLYPTFSTSGMQGTPAASYHRWEQLCNSNL